MKVDAIRYVLMKQSAELKYEIKDLKNAYYKHLDISSFFQEKIDKLTKELRDIEEELKTTKYADSVVTSGEIADSLDFYEE